MESDRTGNNNPSDVAKNGLQRARPLHGRTSGPTRRSTKGQWTAEEDEILRMAVQRFKGKNWKKIAECFKDRTDVQCLHRWQKVLNPELVKGPWSKEEDEVITELVNKYGPKKWSTIASHLPGRIGKQCRERWHNHLNPNINKEAWTQDEELTLIRAHQIYGNKWAELTKFLPGRTDNSIKNHWNSSVKKKLDMYLASGLLSQFQGQPLVNHPNQSEPSSSSKAQQSSEDNSVVRSRIEAEEASECSQGSNIASMSQPTSNPVVHPVGDCRITEESSSIQYPEDYRPAFQEAAFSIPEAPCELSDKFLEHDFSLDWGALAGKDWQLNPNELPYMSLLDLGQESPGMFVVTSSSGRNSNHEELFQQESHMPLGTYTSMVNMAVDADATNMVSTLDCRMVYTEADQGGCCPSEVINQIDSLLHSSTLLFPENGAFASQSCYTPSDTLGPSFPQCVPFPIQLPSADGQHMFGTHPNKYSISHADQEANPPSTHGFIYPPESDHLQCEDNFVEEKGTPILVSVNDFVLTSSNDSQGCSFVDKDTKTEEQKDSGSLFYEPPRFPSLDIPFFSCDLIQSGSDMHQEYSPLGIRQLMLSSMTPFKLWDSPTRDDSPDAILKSAAKTFTGTPSILKKRHRDLVSPLSEKRGEKKLEGPRNQESFSNMNSGFPRLEFMFDECKEKKGQLLSLSPNRRNFEVSCMEKENAAPASGQEQNEGNKSIVTSERDTAEGSTNNGSGCSNSMTKNAEKDLTVSANESSGILLEHDVNDLLFFSPDRFIMKNDRTVGSSARALAKQSSRRLDAVSKHGAVLTSSDACFSVLCSPRLGSKNRTNLFRTTSLQSSSPSAKKVEASGKGLANENNMFAETPPSIWKSPWFINNFGPGPKVDTDISIEDIGYFLTPGDGSYDAIGLMKQLGEQTAGAFADAQKVLGDETPETIMKGKCVTNPDGEKEHNHNPCSASSFMSERRTLDFSECGTPGKESARFSSSTSLSSPSSYLLKSCR
ncbi:transcription factor MYB3R-1-like [Salvia splendens]|uniref:transcription factor MYB3R-1-like n=1 Tax=Salvia splendens TaxID=180675 RepID=UPI001C25A9C4|nr:transcription factor MYB3R-1-like [Salvia splendens]XP_042064887.1 transcription factor MYB3R-1-like [Salvia splendens]XP_042064888.1 transcription factor MYB3R-1-like [Salvia splendens]